MCRDMNHKQISRTETHTDYNNKWQEQSESLIRKETKFKDVKLNIKEANLEMDR